MQKGISGVFFWNHLYISNSNFFFILLILSLNFFFIWIASLLVNTKILYNTDYFFALANLNNFLPLLFLANTIFTFFFILEVNSTIVFYKFIVSKMWYNKADQDSSTQNNNLVSTNHLNVLFFQYWSTFFSSTIFLFFLINIIYMYGSTEFFFLNFLTIFQTILNYNLNTIYFFLLFAAFIFSFFLKIGFAPLQLFKIEVYKGIPFLSIFFYTTFYFLVYFLYFGLLLFIHLSNFLQYIYVIVVLFIIFGGLFVISLLFDINFIKAFFAYSTLLNSVLFLSVLVSGAL